MTPELQASLFCNLNGLTPPERADHRALTSRLLESIRVVEEMAEGFAFRIDGARFSIVDLARWSDLERRCCPFFGFELALDGGAGPLTLRLTGPEGVKEFIESEFAPAFDLQTSGASNRPPASSRPLEAAGRIAPATETAERNVRVVLDLFRAIEERDPDREDNERELALMQPTVEFDWPPALPYGGAFRGLTRPAGRSWSATWNPLQPTAAERRMDPRVVGADDREVAVVYRQRGISPDGERFDGEVLGLYELRDFKLSRARMFYFDEAGACRFLERARR